MDQYYDFKIVWWKEEGKPDPDEMPWWDEPREEPGFKNDRPTPRNIVKWMTGYYPEIGLTQRPYEPGELDIDAVPNPKPRMVFEKPVAEKDDEPYPKRVGLFVPAMMIAANMDHLCAIEKRSIGFGDWLRQNFWPKPPYDIESYASILRAVVSFPNRGGLDAFFPDGKRKMFKSHEVLQSYEELQSYLPEYFMRQAVAGRI